MVLQKKFFWLQHDDDCWILIENVYCKVDAPSTGSIGGFYCFDKKMQKTESYFN